MWAHRASGTMSRALLFGWALPSKCCLLLRGRSHSSALASTELQWLCTHSVLFTVKLPSIVADSCRGDHRAAPPKPRKVWITPDQKVQTGTNTHRHTHTESVVVSQEWITSLCFFHRAACDPDSWCVKRWLLSYVKHRWKDMRRDTREEQRVREDEEVTPGRIHLRKIRQIIKNN